MIDDDGILSMSTQELIDSGQAWLMEGHIGRQCMAAIENGYAVLGPTAQRDYWGNRIPARTEVQPGTLGSIEYANKLREQRGEEPIETDRAFHERIATMEPEAGLAELDARYHDHLPEGSNCHLCGVEHAAISPETLR